MLLNSMSSSIYNNLDPKYISIHTKGLFTQGHKRKRNRIRNVNLEWFKTVEAFTLGHKRKRTRKFTFTAAVFAGLYSIPKTV